MQHIWQLLAASCALAVLLTPAATQAKGMGDMPAMEDGLIDGGMPLSESGGGDFFSQELGTLLRMRYNTQSYGQDQTGNLDLGTMRITNFEDAIAFFDGQVTLSDVNGVGYDLGVGFRWLGWAPFPMEPERITGFSFWTDGTSTESGNFFPQVGVSYESLGDMWDLRINGYIPLGQKSQVGDFTPTGNIVFNENFLVTETLADRNTSLNVAEAEIARRIMPDRDAWAFVGPYYLANDDQDAVGYRAGMRGYAYPDLLLQIAVTDDDIFKTNAAFSVTWFVGRTRNDFRPAYGLPDRMREPVMRNDYVALAKDTVTGGDPLTDVNGDPFRFVHANSQAAPGGDGTYENPVNNVGNVFSNSQDGDIVLLYSDSVFTGQSTLVLRDNQRLLGEGNNETFQIVTQQAGTIDIPETSPGARAGARARIVGTTGPGGAVQLADANEVANFNIDGTGSAANLAGIFSPTAGAGNPNIHDMNISNTTGDGIQFTPLTRVDEDNPSLLTVAGNVTIDDLIFDNVGGNEININSATTENVTNPNVTLLETILISDVTSTNGNGRGVWLRNTHDNRTATILNYTNGVAGTAGSGGGLTGSGVLVFEGSSTNEFDGNVTLTNVDIFNNIGFALDFANIDPTSAITVTNNNGFTYNGGAGAAGGMRFNNFNGTFTGNSSTLTGGTLSGVQVTGVSDGTINLTSTVTFDEITGTVIDVGFNATDNFTGALTVAGTIENSVGRSVSLQRISTSGSPVTSVTISGDITETAASQGILVNDNSGGTIIFSGDITQNLIGQTGIMLTDNAGADISFGGILDITTTGAGEGFSATGGGTLTVGGNANSITTNGARAVEITGMTISNAGANFAEVNATGGNSGIVLETNTGGAITFGILGDDPGETGTITGTTGNAVVINNSANVVINSLRINATAGQSGVAVNKTTTGAQITNLNDLEINGGANGVEVTGNGGTGALNMTVNDTSILSSTAFGLTFDNIDAGTIQVNNTTIDGNNASAGNVGVRILNSNATFTFDSDAANDDTVIQEFGSTDFLVDGGTPNITFNGRIVNSSTNLGDNTGRSLVIQNTTGGNKTFSSTSTITDDNEGMLVQNNSSGTVSVLGTNTFTMSGTNDAITLDNNDVSGTNASIILAGLNITATGAARGLVATNGGTLAVTGLNNSIDTENGAGLVITDMTIGSAVDFAEVTVDGGTGPLNAIVLQNLTGGQVAIGSTTGAADSGGQLRATGDAIILQNVQNVDLRQMQIISAGGQGVNINHTAAATTQMDVTIDGLNLDSSTGTGIDVLGENATNTFNLRLTDGDYEEAVVINQTGAGTFQLLVDSTDIDTILTDVAFTLGFSGSARNGDVTIRNDSNFTSANASALVYTANGTNIDVDLRIDDNDFVNNSGVATSQTASFLINGGATSDFTIVNNSFTNSGAAAEFAMTSDGSSTRTNLDLDNNTATVAGVYLLDTLNQGVPGTDFNFGVVDRPDVDDNNIGTVTFVKPINEYEDIDGPLPQPTVP